jgi:CheY-like chemotaxis protein
MDLPDLKVLIAEDNIVNQKVISFPFIKNNIIPKIAKDGKIAFEMFKEEHFDLILMDINMPVMNGVESTIEIRKYEKENNLKPSVIIAVTANILAEEKEAFLKYGLNDIIIKPIDFEKMLACIKKHYKI